MAASDDQKDKPKKSNIFKRLWMKSGLNTFMVLLAIKGALPTTISLAAYEGDSFAETYTTLGYLVAIISHLTLAIQPRAKFIQSTLIAVLFICTGAACALIEIQCVVAARSTGTGGTRNGASGSTEAQAYDSSSNIVAAIWLFVFVFIANYVKSARPQMMLPVIQLSIFTIVASVYAPSFPTMRAGESFVRRLLITFLSGHSIGAAVSLFILPVTSRGTVSKQMGGLTRLIKACLASHSAYMGSTSNNEKREATQQEVQNAMKVKMTVVAMGELLGKIKLELGFARKEIAFGKLCPEDFSKMFQMFREVCQPVMGLSTFLEMMRAFREHQAVYADTQDAKDTMEAMRKLQREEWDEVIKISQEAQLSFHGALMLGLDHIVYQLELEKKPKKKVDIEGTAGSTPQPGEHRFAKYLEEELAKYQADRFRVIQDWAEHRKLNLPNHFWETAGHQPQPIERQETILARRKINQHQLYLVLYLNFLTHSTGQAILRMSKFADNLHETGTMSKKRIINPGYRRIRKLFADAFTSSNTDETLAAEANSGSKIYLGDALKAQKDPEHLPPSNFYERATDKIRLIPRFFHNEHAHFGFRAAVAALSIGIIGFLSSTRPFFLQQRGIWAMIMTAISMDPHSGQGIFGFLARLGGTAFAMVSAIVIWYMCDHNHAAILVVFWIYMSCWTLFMIKMPQYAPIAMISSITVVLIIGYELQVDIIGRELATSNGQAWYPVELLAPYRLAAVAIGLGVGFFWTYFPYPITTHGALRTDLGSTLYILANYYSCVHTTIEARLHLGPDINDLPTTHPIKRLDSARLKVFGKVLLMLTRLREYHRFARFEPPTGGKFPSETYDELITAMRNVFTYLSLIVYSSNAFIQPSTSSSVGDEELRSEEGTWQHAFRNFTATSTITSHELTTTLCLLSASIRNSQPLPPYLQAPRAFTKSNRTLLDNIHSLNMDATNNNENGGSLLSVQHLTHPCYAAFAVGEVASAFITAEMGKIVKLVKKLVGEVDFSFHVISTSADGDGGSTASTLFEMDSGSGSGNGRKGKHD